MTTPRDQQITEMRELIRECEESLKDILQICEVARVDAMTVESEKLSCSHDRGGRKSDIFGFAVGFTIGRARRTIKKFKERYNEGEGNV